MNRQIIFLFPLSSILQPNKILSGTPANLDNGIRALPRFSGAGEEQEEGAVL